jgi:hypothetical protein
VATKQHALEQINAAAQIADDGTGGVRGMKHAAPLLRRLGAFVEADLVDVRELPLDPKAPWEPTVAWARSKGVEVVNDGGRQAALVLDAIDKARGGIKEARGILLALGRVVQALGHFRSADGIGDLRKAASDLQRARGAATIAHRDAQELVDRVVDGLGAAERSGAR